MRRRYVHFTLAIDIPDGVPDEKLERALAFIDQSEFNEPVEIGGKKHPLRIVPRDFILNSISDFPSPGRLVQQTTTRSEDVL
jgi:hypothetical protein